MSYQLNNEINKKNEIEMPPLPEVADTLQASEQPKMDMHPELQNTLPTNPEEIQEPEPAVEQPKAAKESANEKNIRALREKAERSERMEWERDEALRRLQQYEASKQQAPQEIEEPDYNIDENDLVEGKHLKQYSKKLKKMQQDLQQQQQQNQLTATEIRLKNEFPDFDKVVSTQNIEQLRNGYPELADTLNRSTTDIYAKAKSAYQLIKKLGIVVDDVYEQDRDKALKNAAKPRPLASVSPQQGDSPLSKANAFANGLTDELAKQLRKEMYDSMKNR